MAICFCDARVLCVESVLSDLTAPIGSLSSLSVFKMIEFLRWFKALFLRKSAKLDWWLSYSKI